MTIDEKVKGFIAETTFKNLQLQVANEQLGAKCMTLEADLKATRLELEAERAKAAKPRKRK